MDLLCGGAAGNLMLSLTATNGFNGPVTFSCSPATVACTFNPATVTLSGSATTLVAVAIAPVAPPAPVGAPPPTGGGGYSGYNKASHSAHLFRSRTGLTLAFIGPVGLFAFASLKRRSILAGGSLLALLLLVVATAITGCSSSTGSQQAPTCGHRYQGPRTGSAIHPCH